MKKLRFVVPLAVLGAFTAAGIVAAQGPDSSLVITDAEGDVAVLELPGNVDVVAASTTTTQPPTTTTTVPPTTTTTLPPTTTTTTLPPLGPDPTPVLEAGSYDIWVIGRLAQPDAVMMWRAPYHRELSSGAGWDDGDRSAYRGGYGFLHHNPAGPEPDAQVFRFMFAGGYGGTIPTLIGDERMNEAERFYDCTRYDVAPPSVTDAHGCGVVVGPSVRELRDTPRPDWIGSTVMPPDRRPVIRVVHTATGQVVEVRSYLNPVDKDPGTTFGPLQHLTEPFQDRGDDPNPDKPDAYDSGPHTVYERFVVGAWLDGDNAVAVYYDVLDPDYHLDISYPLED